MELLFWNSNCRKFPSPRALVHAGQVRQGCVAVAGALYYDPSAESKHIESLRFTVQGTDWEGHAKDYLMLYK